MIPKPAALLLAAVTLAACTRHEAPGTVAGDVASQQASAQASQQEDIAQTAGFDCTKAASGLTQIICDDPQLAAMDSEVARLTGLAMHAPGADIAAIRAAHTAWLGRLNGCSAKSVGGGCLATEYARRIADLRASGLAQDDKGVSLGPVRWTCPGGVTLTSTFINTATALAWVSKGDETWLLSQTVSASGARYAVDDYVFWTKGRQTMWTEPGKPAVPCHQVDQGAQTS